MGAVQDWADGSKADAVKMVHELIKELELEVCDTHTHRQRPAIQRSVCGLIAISIASANDGERHHFAS